MNIHDREMMIGRTKEASGWQRCASGNVSLSTSISKKMARAEDCAPGLPPGTASGTHGLTISALTAHACYRTAASGMFGDTDGKRDAMPLHQTGDWRLLFCRQLDRLLAL